MEKRNTIGFNGGNPLPVRTTEIYENSDESSGKINSFLKKISARIQEIKTGQQPLPDSDEEDFGQ